MLDLINTLNYDGLVKNRHTREGGYPESLQQVEKTGFPIKDFGNDGMKKTVYETVNYEG